MAPFVEARDRLDTITGVGKRAAECIIAEIGVDMSVFPDRRASVPRGPGCARRTTSPAANAAPDKTNKGNRWLGEILNQCAWAAARSRNTYLSAQFWRLARRIGKKKAAVAVSHSILVIAWHLLTNNSDYHDLGGDYFTRRTTPPANAPFPVPSPRLPVTLTTAA